MKGIVLLTFVLLFGCYKAPTLDELKKADYGQYPSNYEALVKQCMEGKLFDPGAAMYKFTPPVKGYTNRAPMQGGDVDKFGYWVAAEINGKNRFGGYTGYQAHRFFIRAGDIYNACSYSKYGLMCDPC